MAYNVNTVKIEGQEEFKQEPIPELPPVPLNIETVPQGSTLRDGDFFSPSFRESRAGWRLRSNGDAEFNNAIIRGTIVIGGQYRTVAVGDSIQDAIDAVYSAGGGTVVLENGTHTPGSNITLYPSVTLQGQNSETAIIDFQNGSYQIKCIGTGAYTTGTVSISNNGTSVTGVGTSWSGNVSAGQYILLAGIWYPISVVGGNTSITIALPYADVALSGATYTIATIVSDIRILDLVVKNSATSAVKFQYANEFVIDNINTQTNVTGVELDTCSQVVLGNIDATANYYNYSLTNTHFCTFFACGSIDALVGNGITLNTVSNTAISTMFCLNSAGDGLSMTSCSNMRVDGVFTENAGQGIEMVSGNDNIIFSGLRVQSNTSDGIKLTATSDNAFISNGFIKDNGGYGINNVASSNDSLVITGNNFSGNSSGAVNDSGTGTVIRGNVGVADNGTSGSGTITKTYTAGQDLTAKDAVFIADGTQAFTLYDKSVTETTTTPVGSSSGNQRRATQLIPSSTVTVDKINIALTKTGSPVDNLIIAIQADSGGNPSGTDLATVTLAGGSLGAGPYTLSTEITLTASTTYWVVLSRSGAVDAVNYYNQGVKVGGNDKSYNGTSWSSQNTDTQVTVVHTVPSGEVLKTEADTATYYEGFIGFNNSTVSQGSDAMVVIGGEVTGLSGLTASTRYYLSDVSGAISSTAGTNTRKVGIATSQTTLLITNIW